MKKISSSFSSESMKKSHAVIGQPAYLVARPENENPHVGKISFESAWLTAAAVPMMQEHKNGRCSEHPDHSFYSCSISMGGKSFFYWVNIWHSRKSP